MATFSIDLLTGKPYLFSGDFTNSGMTTFSGVTTVDNGLSMATSRKAKLGGTLICSTILTKGAGNTAGIEYGGDYSASFSNRSLVDKEYVNNRITGSTPSWLILTNRPAWLTGTTLSVFQTGHTHSYGNLTNKLTFTQSGITTVVQNGSNVTIYTPSTNVTLQLIDNLGNAEVNVISAVTLTWTTQEFSGTTFNFTGGSKILITENGIYGIGYTLNFVNEDAAPKNIGTVVRKNGDTIIAPTTSASLSTFPYYSAVNIMSIYKTNLLAGDYVELIAYRIGDAGSALTIPGGSWITVIKYNT
jgi:hypothetical protein